MSDFGLKRSDFQGRPGYWEKPAKVWRPGVGMVDGFKWGCRVPKVKRSKREVSAADLGDMIRPATERHRIKAATDMEKRGDVRLVSDNGYEYVPKETADIVAEKNGWHSDWSGGRATSVLHRGPDGMLFRHCKAGWEPLGVRCLGTPLTGSANVSRREIQRDPDGNPWKWSRGEWVRA